MEEDRMLSDEILLGIINAKSGGGGGGGTDDYNDLKNQPKIEGVTLKGNKTAADLGLATAAALADKVDKVQGKGLSTNDFTDAYKTAIGDNTTALALKQNATDNSLQTTDKTVVGAINENAGDIGQLKSGLTNLSEEVNGDATTYPYADVITIPDAVPANLADCTVKIEPLQSGSGDPSPTNIRPITGHTEASVQRTGKNLCPIGDMSIIESDRFTLNAGHYAISFDCAGSKIYSTSRVIIFANDSTVLLEININQGAHATGTFTLTENTAVRFYINNYNPDSDGYYIKNVQIELGQTATPYEPYQGKTYTIALGDTIYGGTVDFDTGVMTVDRKYVAPTSDAEIESNSASLPSDTWLVKVNDGKEAGRIISNMYDNSISASSPGNCRITSSGKIRVKTYQAYNSVADAYNGAFNGSQFCYELATPFTIQLTPQQIQLLKGQNTITASTGQISVTVNGVSGSIGAVQEQVNGLAEEVAEIKPVNYSTTEQKTGQKWIDGKDIYFCTFTGLTITTTGNWQDTGIDSSNMDTILGGLAIDDYKQSIVCSFGFGTNPTVILRAYMSTNVIKSVTLFYTKTA